MKPSDILSAVKACYLAKAPLAIWGAPGIGKTAIATAAHAELASQFGDDFQKIYLRANLIEPIDVTGLPIPSGDCVKPESAPEAPVLWVSTAPHGRHPFGNRINFPAR